jgi:hypothetical protein
MSIEKPRNNNTWTESQFRGFIMSLLRKGSTRWGPRNACKKDARHHKKIPNASGRLVYHGLCNCCHKLYPETECSIDHIAPVIDPASGFKGWDEVIERMYCENPKGERNCHEQKKIKQ